MICVFSILAVFGTIAAFWLYYWLLSEIESTKAMMISLVTPLIAVVIGGVFWTKKSFRQTFFGGILIMASIGLRMFSQKKTRSNLYCRRYVWLTKSDKILLFKT